MVWLAILFTIVAAIAYMALRRPVRSTDAHPDPLLRENAIRARALALRDELSREPFGEELARAVWQALMQTSQGEGVIYARHRDFCGQGLIRTPDGVKLCDIQDGGYMTGEPIAAWASEADFVAFFSRQSDYTCSGWDATSAVFASDDAWYRNNQRLQRDVLERFVAGDAPRE